MSDFEFDAERFGWGFRGPGQFVGKAREATSHSPLLVPPLEGTELVELERAGRRVLAEDVRTAQSVPAWPVASVEGYSLRAADTFGATQQDPVTLPLSVSPPMPAYQGLEPSGSLTEGTRRSVRMLSRLPEGADAVVPHDAAEYVGQGLQRGQGAMHSPIAKGRGVVPAAAECRAGGVVLHEGTRLHGAHVALLAMAGVPHVRVTVRPRVAVLAVHDYFKGPNAGLDSSWAPDALTPLILTLLSRWGWPASAVEHFEHDGVRNPRGLPLRPLKPQIDALSSTHDFVIVAGMCGLATPYLNTLLRDGGGQGFGSLGTGLLAPIDDGWVYQGGPWSRPVVNGMLRKLWPLRVLEDEELLAPLGALLEGWPASILASMYLQVRPVLHALEGHGLRREGPPSSYAAKRPPAPGTGTGALRQMPRWLHGVTADPAPRHAYGPWLHLACFDGADAQGRQLLRVLPMFEWTIAAFAQAEAMVAVGPGTEDLPAGSPVQFFLLD